MVIMMKGWLMFVVRDARSEFIVYKRRYLKPSVSRKREMRKVIIVFVSG
jgi:hypothetical protein